MVFKARSEGELSGPSCLLGIPFPAVPHCLHPPPPWARHLGPQSALACPCLQSCSALRLPLSKMGSLPALQGWSPVQPISPSARGCALVHPGQGESCPLGSRGAGNCSPLQLALSTGVIHHMGLMNSPFLGPFWGHLL